jgi:hypothetical protein
MILFLAVLTLSVLGWIAFKPAWLPTPPENKMTNAVAKSVVTATHTARHTAGPRLTGLFDRRSAAGKKLKAWAGEVDLAKEAALFAGLPEETTGLTTWLQSLSDTEAAQLAAELDQFCHTLNLELAWLYDPAEAEMKAAMKQVVALYGLSLWKARQLQTLAAFQAWQLAPEKREHRVMTEKLYLKLSEAGLVTAPANLLLASDKERQAHVVKAIQAAATQDRAAVLAMVAELRTAAETEPQARKKSSKPAENLSAASASMAEVAA